MEDEYGNYKTKESLSLPVDHGWIIGPGVSHKTKIIEMYIEGYDFLDIKRRTRHSSGSITRYLRDFARIMVLHESSHNPREIRIITDHSDRLVREYLDLYNRMNTEIYQEMLDQLRAMYQRKKKRGIVIRRKHSCSIGDGGLIR